jgi:hypothetical protein
LALLDVRVELCGPNFTPASVDASSGVTTWHGSMTVGTGVASGDSAGASEGVVEVVGSIVGADDWITTASDGCGSWTKGPVAPPPVEEHAARLMAVRTMSARVARVAIGRG